MIINKIKIEKPVNKAKIFIDKRNRNMNVHK